MDTGQSRIDKHIAKMWKSVVLVLFLMTTSYATEECLTEVATPTDLVVGFNSDTVVTLFWYFPGVGNLSENGLEFVVLLEGDDEPTQEFPTGPISRPFKKKLKDLSPSTAYFVTLWATQPGCEDSSHAYFEFDTLEHDWPSPVLTGMIRVRNRTHEIYELNWIVEPFSDSLKYLAIEMCLKQCHRVRRGPRDVSINFAFPRESEFAVRVFAVYETPGIWEVERSSQYFTGLTAFPAFGVFLRNTSAVQVGNQVMLEWHEMFAPGEPRTYYDIYLRDPRTENDIFSDITSVLSRSFLNRTGTYELKFDGENDVQVGDPLTYDLRPANEYQCIRPREPLELRIVKRTVSDVHFRIYFPEPKEANSEEADVDRERSVLRLGPSVKEAFGLSAYEMVKVKIRNCVDFGEHEPDACGNFLQFTTLSNVGGPSQVQYPEIYMLDDETGALIWELPEERRGPIDGFKVITRPNQSAVTLESLARFYVLEKFDIDAPYNIAIAAFNLDLENKTREHIGEWHFLVSPGRCGQCRGYIVWIAYATFPVLMIAAFCWSVYQRREALVVTEIHAEDAVSSEDAEEAARSEVAEEAQRSEVAEEAQRSEVAEEAQRSEVAEEAENEEYVENTEDSLSSNVSIEADVESLSCASKKTI